MEYLTKKEFANFEVEEDSENEEKEWGQCIPVTLNTSVVSSAETASL